MVIEGRGGDRTKEVEPAKLGTEPSSEVCSRACGALQPSPLLTETSESTSSSVQDDCGGPSAGAQASGVARIANWEVRIEKPIANAQPRAFERTHLKVREVGVALRLRWWVGRGALWRCRRGD